ncbi:NACHT domain-containing protein [Rathayibacter sp. ZW T2_19]|uniref:NACHT domain-containing protein n=1 Tax=Rathayibacter rubneri TaxID=2950106 RepID=A0A9X2IS53_9MICO|nr:NACHT domain-containing protein [Rathayibacter rubneri]MCM6762326.1 NACHT domain-containing protein [Rathayibacter rubneri]
MDAVSLAIGTAATKWVIRLWTNNDDLASLSGELIQALPSRIGGLLERGRAKRQFERLAEDIGARIFPYLSHELSDIDAGDLSAAAHAAQRALENSVKTQVELAKIDFDAELLCAMILAKDEPNLVADGLSTSGDAAYESIVRECAACIIASSSALPTFQHAGISEILSRETTIIDLVEANLANMPESQVPSTWGRGSEYQRFESRYRRAIFDHADRLQLFGVTSPTARSSYSLSVAYIPLETLGNESKSNADEKPNRSDALRVEEALSGSPRILLTGGAGGGKTTLLHWITTKSAQQSFENKLEEWNNRVPFVIQLRRYANSTLPHIGQFIEGATPSLLDAMPSGWATSIFDAGRALLLVDGFDEISEDGRASVLSWLNEISNSFSDAIIIVTSREGAVDSSWTADDYTRVTLLPMEYEDIKSFVEHWHRAALGPSPTAELSASIRTSEKFALEAIRERQAIRSLCDSPLLCALICALNRDSGARLPDNRMEIYSTALQMLVVRRDQDRHVEISHDLQLTYSEASSILRIFASWLQDNYAADAARADFETIVGKQLVHLHRIKATSEEVAKHLLARSGVLREPSDGRIDFVHRTFLEYLAAGEIVANRSFGKLVAVANEDYWREVVVLAAGHATARDREELISALIARGEKEPGNRHVLFLVALACMETSPELSPDLQKSLARCLAAVVPPSNMTDAASVALAGQMAVSLLSRRPRYAREAVASVRALSLIGGDGALAALRGYRTDRRKTVIRQLLRAWSHFDAEAFAKEILADSPVADFPVPLSDWEQIRQLPSLPNMHNVRLSLTGELESLAKVPKVASVRFIDLSRSLGLSDLGGGEGLTGVLSIDSRWCFNLTTLAGIEAFPELAILDLEGCSNLVDIKALSAVSHLNWLDLSRTPVSSTESLSSLEELHALYLVDCENLTTLGALASLDSLTLSALPSLSEWDLRPMEKLTTLRLGGPISPAEIVLPDSIQNLSLDWGSKFTAKLLGARKVRSFRAANPENIAQQIEFIQTRKDLVSVDLLSPAGRDVSAFIPELLNRKRMRTLLVQLVSPELGFEWPTVDGFDSISTPRRAIYTRKLKKQ